jgi:hypothetical protein
MKRNKKPPRTVATALWAVNANELFNDVRNRPQGGGYSDG